MLEEDFVMLADVVADGNVDEGRTLEEGVVKPVDEVAGGNVLVGRLLERGVKLIDEAVPDGKVDRLLEDAVKPPDELPVGSVGVGVSLLLEDSVWLVNELLDRGVLVD